MALVKSEQFDFQKYGLTFIPTDEEIETYQREFDYGNIIEVWNANRTISVVQINNIGRFKIASKYYCESQKEFEFLLFNGDVGRYFAPDIFYQRQKIQNYLKIDRN